MCWRDARKGRVFNPTNTERTRKRPAVAAEEGNKSRKKKKDVNGRGTPNE